MDVKIDSTKFAHVVSRAQSASGGLKPTRPILSTVRLKAEGSTLAARGTDDFVGVDVYCEAKAKTPGCYALDAKRLSDIARVVPAGEVRIKSDKAGGHVVIQAGKSRFKVATIHGDEFPPVPEAPTGVDVTVDGEALSRALTQGAYAAALKGKPSMEGACFDFEGGQLQVVSTDGNRMAVAACECAGTLDAFTLQPRGLAELKKLCGEGNVTIGREGRHVFFKRGQEVLSSLTVDEAFPPWRKIVETLGTENALEVPKADLVAAVKRVSVAARSTEISAAKDAGMIRVTKGSLEVLSQDDAASDTIDCACDFEAEKCFAVPMLAEAVNAIEGDTLLLELGKDDTQPLVIRPVGNPGTFALVMPRRV